MEAAHNYHPFLFCNKLKSATYGKYSKAHRHLKSNVTGVKVTQLPNEMGRTNDPFSRTFIQIFICERNKLVSGDIIACKRLAKIATSPKLLRQTRFEEIVTFLLR